MTINDPTFFLKSALDDLISGNEENLHGECFFLAESEDFYDSEAQEHFHEVYADYEAQYNTWAAQMEKLLGVPSFKGGSRDKDFPKWSLGERATVWESHSPPIYITLWHSDRENPIYVVLARCGFQSWQEGAKA